MPVHLEEAVLVLGGEGISIPSIQTRREKRRVKRRLLRQSKRRNRRALRLGIRKPWTIGNGGTAAPLEEHRYWKFYLPTGNDVAATYIQEVAFISDNVDTDVAASATISINFGSQVGLTSNLTDNDLTTVDGLVTLNDNQGTEQSIEFDFGAGFTAPLYKFGLHSHYDSASSADSPKMFAAYYSDDGITWTFHYVGVLDNQPSATPGWGYAKAPEVLGINVNTVNNWVGWASIQNIASMTVSEFAYKNRLEHLVSDAALPNTSIVTSEFSGLFTVGNVFSGGSGSRWNGKNIATTRGMFQAMVHEMASPDFVTEAHMQAAQTFQGSTPVEFIFLTGDGETFIGLTDWLSEPAWGSAETREYQTNVPLSVDETISYTGSHTDWTSDYAGKVAFVLGGAGGGGAGTTFGTFVHAGPGALTRGEVTVAVGDVLRVQVGEGGDKGTASVAGLGGWPDGGDGKDDSGDVRSGGGGGSTRLWKSTDGGTTWKLIAVAGAGAGTGYSSGGYGGVGGGTSGGDSENGGGGSGGSQVAGGVDRSEPAEVAKQGVGMSTTDPTPSKTGGDGGDGAASDDGGGGGGGFFGGGGGGGDGVAGGGGSGYLDAEVTNGEMFMGTADGGGSVVPPEMSRNIFYPGGDESKGGSRGNPEGTPGKPGWARLWAP